MNDIQYIFKKSTDEKMSKFRNMIVYIKKKSDKIDIFGKCEQISARDKQQKDVKLIKKF